MSAVSTYGLLIVAALVAGSLAGGLTAWCIVARREAPEGSEVVELAIDPSVEAELELAAARWGAERHQPEAVVGLLSDHLKQLCRLSLRKGWF
jgi:hypothetical protein